MTPVKYFRWLGASWDILERRAERQGYIFCLLRRVGSPAAPVTRWVPKSALKTPGPDPVNVGDHPFYSPAARAWLDREERADPDRVNNTMYYLLRRNTVRPFRPSEVSRMAKLTIDRGDFDRFIAVVKFARLRRFVEA